MADNVAVTPGSGDTIAADDVGGVKHQRVKISIGADGVATDLAAVADTVAVGAIVPAAPILWDQATTSMVRQRSGGQDAQSSAYMGAAAPMLYNGSTHDRQRGNEEGTLLASAARTATTYGSYMTNYNARGVVIQASVSVAGTGNIKIQINMLPGGVTEVAFVESAAFATTGSKILMAYPGVLDADVMDDGRSVVLPRTWRAGVVKSDASSWTFSLQYALIV